MTTYDIVFKRFEAFCGVDAVLEFTDTQKEMMGDILEVDMDEAEWASLKTCFFRFDQLEQTFQESLWAYGLMNCEIESEIDEKRVVPFAALNASGKSLDYGQDVFAETNNWGVLCLVLKDASADDCAVVWVYDGEVFQWSDKVSALEAG